MAVGAIAVEAMSVYMKVRCRGDKHTGALREVGLLDACDSTEKGNGNFT